MAPPTIRLYRPADRPAVRAIACETAERGEPVERFFPDREVFADLLTMYYTDWEPDALWVAEQDSRVMGYLTGCLDTRRYHRVMAARIIPRAAWLGLRRGALLHRETWRLAQAGLVTWRLGGLAHVPLDAYPAHLHCNIAPGFRDRQAGTGLVTQFLTQVADARLPGVHAAVRGDNARACRFFERLGFAMVGRARVAWPAGRTLTMHETLMYGKRL